MYVQSEGCLAMLAVMPFLVLVVDVGCPVVLYVEVCLLCACCYCYQPWFFQLLT